MIKVAPSILSADFANLGAEVQRVDQAGADYIHIDVMDGTFVPNITLGSPVVKALRKVTKKPFDVHLMVEHPETQIDAFADAGADLISFHIEAVRHSHRLVQQIKAHGIKAAAVLNPGTSLASIEEILGDLDMVLLMTVNPGFGGQKFIASQLEKIHMLRHTIDEMNFNCDIEVDGGINPVTSKQVREAGANVLVAGSAVYGAADMAKAIAEIRGEEA